MQASHTRARASRSGRQVARARYSPERPSLGNKRDGWRVSCAVDEDRHRDPVPFWLAQADAAAWHRKPIVAFDREAGVYGRWFPEGD